MARTANADEKSPRTTMTVSLPSNEKKALKLYAIENGTTVSNIVSLWVQHYCFRNVPMPYAAGGDGAAEED